MNQPSIGVYHHVDASHIPEGKEPCEEVEFKHLTGSTVTFKLKLYMLELVVFYDSKHTNQFLDKLRVAVRECEEALATVEEEKKEKEPTDTEDIHDPPDMGMDDRSRED